MKKLPLSLIAVNSEISLFHVGPALDHGPLPTFFYFALSGPDSLTLDPFNQPVQFLSDRFMRIFSMTLPAHEAGLDPRDAFSVWAEEFQSGKDPLAPFLEQAKVAIDYTVRQKLADPEKMAIGGLSRGGLFASFLAADDNRFKTMVLFAPTTDLSLAKEFLSLKENPLVQTYRAHSLAADLSDRNIRLFIGNRDTKVYTRSCLELALLLAEKSNLRSPQISLIVSPPVGMDGHGTPPEIFSQGAEWIASQLKSTYV